jgi:hypothetical protein
MHLDSAPEESARRWAKLSGSDKDLEKANENQEDWKDNKRYRGPVLAGSCWAPHEDLGLSRQRRDPHSDR